MDPLGITVVVHGAEFAAIAAINADFKSTPPSIEYLRSSLPTGGVKRYRKTNGEAV